MARCRRILSIHFKTTKSITPSHYQMRAWKVLTPVLKRYDITVLNISYNIVQLIAQKTGRARKRKGAVKT